MTTTTRRFVALLFPLLLTAYAAHAQTWALPAPGTQNAEVICPATCPAAAMNKPTVGYSGAIKGFTGRFCDSQSTADWQFPLRTVRADAIKVAPNRHRVYVQMGSALFAYDDSTFFTKLKTGQTMSAKDVLESKRLIGATENFLPFDTYFNAEYSESRWITPRQDGQERLYDFDFDDRNLIYLTTASYFGWGIVRDNPADHDQSLMENVTQVYPAVSPDIWKLAVLKLSGHYYLLGSSTNSHSAQLWDVTDATAPQRLPDLQRGFKRIARTADMARFATLDDAGKVIINSVQQLGTGGSYGTFRPSSGAGFADVTSDGTNFFAVWSTPAVQLMVTAFIYNADTDSYTPREIPVGGARFDASNGTITAGAGYLTVVGQGEQGYDMRLIKVDASFNLTDLPLNNYIAKYYTSPPSGYVAPGAFIQLKSGLAISQGENVYLAVNAHALGDVYLLEGNDTPAPCVPLDAQHATQTYAGVTAECNSSAASPACHFNEAITFDVNSIGGYNFNCATHTFKWTLPGNVVINTKSFTKVFGAPGDYSVTLEVDTPAAHFGRVFNVHVTPTPVPDPPCQPLTTSNVSYNFASASGSCGPLGGKCAVGEAVTFNVETFGGYNVNCGPHTYTWTIDGTVVAQTRSFVHSFRANGDFPARLTVSNGTSSLNLSFVVHVGANAPAPCPSLSASNVFYTYTNAANTCGPLGGACGAGEPVTFGIETFGYQLACAVHTFTWRLEDTVISQQSTFTHTFPTAGDYPMKLTVNNG
ncbi:MAG: hypothetical protein JWO56_3018, partial [Acidobacteria bacterium]|nr:hypothetical protein [Acidobacteriota bacterium]